MLVNDGSPDNSLEVCRAHIDKPLEPITLVNLARNYGEHNAVMAGLRHASGAHVITMDDVLEKPRGLCLLSFRCMSAFVVREITRYEGPFPCLDGLIPQVTQDIHRLLVRHLPRATGRRNYTLRRLLRLWISMFVNFSVIPLRVSTMTGFVLSALGAIGCVITVAEALFSWAPPGWASLFAAVLLLSGVQLVILGIVGEYLGQLYLTANGKTSIHNKRRYAVANRRSSSRTGRRFGCGSVREPDGVLLYQPRGGDPARRRWRNRARVRPAHIDIDGGVTRWDTPMHSNSLSPMQTSGSRGRS